MHRNYDSNDLLAKAFLIFNAMYVGITGGYLMMLEGVTYSTPTYDLMAGLFSLQTYGLVLVIAGVLYLYAAVQEGRRKHVALIVGGVLSGIPFALYATASFEGSANSLLPLRYAINSGFSFIIAGVGGMAIWKRKH